jgi:hypothetical protein
MSSASEIIKNHEAEIIELERKLELARAQLAGMRMIAENMDQNTTFSNPAHPNSSKKSKRRMRLGSKKRVIFHLVNAGLDTIDKLTEHLSNSEIDLKYVRDVVRLGIEEGDMHGDLDDKFIMSENGKELLAKANLPPDWEKYSDLINIKSFFQVKDQKETPDAQLPPGVSRIHGNEEVSPSSLPDAEESLSRAFDEAFSDFNQGSSSS